MLRGSRERGRTGEHAVRVGQKIGRGAVLCRLPMVHDQHAIGVDDGVQAMSDDDDGASGELRIDGVLHQGVRVRVDGRRRLVQANHL